MESGLVRQREKPLAIDGGAPVRETMLPFNAPYIGTEEIAEVVDTLQSGWITTGPKTKQFERAFAEYVGARFAVALNSCTAGLHLSLVVNGIGVGAEVIVPSLTFGATANVVEHVGARPVIVDIDSETLCMDVNAVERAITPRTRAMIPVHYAGLPCALDALHEIARGKNIIIIEDAAHAIGAEYHGKKIGAHSPLVNFSFYANKNLSTAEGGMVTTNDAALEEKLRVYHLHGLSRDAWKRYHSNTYAPPEIVVPGFKYNMTDIQASLGLHQLRRQENFLARREQLAAFYDDAFAELDGIVTTQFRPLQLRSRVRNTNQTNDAQGKQRDNAARHALHFYPLLLDTERVRVSRNEILNALLAENIGVSMHFQPLHQMPYYREKYGYAPNDLPNAHDIGAREISLPLQPQMSDDDARDVVNAVMRVVNFYRR